MPKNQVDAKKFFWVPKIFVGCQKTTFWHPRMPSPAPGADGPAGLGWVGPPCCGQWPNAAAVNEPSCSQPVYSINILT